MNEEDKKKIETPQKNIRTYESDVADVLAHKNISATTIALAEKKKQTGKNTLGSTSSIGTESTDHSQLLKKSLIGLASLVLIGIGVGGGYYLYMQSPLAGEHAAQPQIAAPISLIPADARVGLSIDGASILNIIATVRTEIQKPQNPDSVKEIVLTQSKNNQKFGITAPDMVKLLDISAPDSLVRSLSNNWMLGVYADAQGQKSPFVVVTVNYFQNAFAGMLQWESVMPDDLKQYIQQNDTTESIIKGSFIDRIIKNKDVREFVGADGNVLFLYSFIDNTKIVITSSESGLSNILTRLEQKAFVR